MLPGIKQFDLTPVASRSSPAAPRDWELRWRPVWPRPELTWFWPAARSARSKQVAAEVARDYGHQAIGVAADVCQPADVEALVQAALKKFGKIDILINNAGSTFADQSMS